MRERREHLVEGLLANRAYGKDACVVLNFMKSGSAEQRDANSGYGNEMMGLMAELGMGPMHMGKAVTLEGDAEFDQVAIVYYPGRRFFGDMILSEYYQQIYRDKQLNDSQAVITAPILDRVEEDERT